MIKFPTAVWEAFNLLHIFPKCSHICREPAILRNTLGFRLDFWNFFPKSFPAKVASAVYPATAWYHFTLLDISIIVFKDPVGMGMSLASRRSHLLLLWSSIIMKALQRSSSKPLPFREARNLDRGKISCHVRISMSSLWPTFECLLPSRLQQRLPLPRRLQNWD